MDEIEKLKQERDEILAKVEELDRLTINLEAVQWPEVSRVLEELRAFRPKPKPLEFWVNTFSDGSCSGYAHEGLANSYGTDSNDRIAVYMREVTPAPKWERWEAVFDGDFWELRGSDGVMSTFISGAIAQKIAAAHNAEMERMTSLWEGGEDE